MGPNYGRAAKITSVYLLTHHQMTEVQMSSESLTSVLLVCYSKIFHWLRRPLLPTECSIVKMLLRQLRGITRVWALLLAFSDTPL